MGIYLGSQRPGCGSVADGTATISGTTVPTVQIEPISSRFCDGRRSDISDPDSLQFIYIHSGAGSIELNSSAHPLRVGSIARTAPGQTVSLEVEPDTTGVWMSLSEIFFGSEVIRSLPGLSAHDVYRNETYYRSDVSRFYEGDDQDASRERLFDELAAASTRLGMGCDPAVCAYALIVLFGAQWRQSVGSVSVSVSDARDLSHSELASRFRQMVGLNFARHFQIQDYCDFMGISRERLTEACKAALRLTPMQVIQERMVLEAKRALLHSAKSISEIGYQLGFSDLGYFSRFIRLRTGMSPRQLRERHRLSEAVHSSPARPQRAKTTHGPAIRRER